MIKEYKYFLLRGSVDYLTLFGGCGSCGSREHFGTYLAQVDTEEYKWKSLPLTRGRKAKNGSLCRIVVVNGLLDFLSLIVRKAYIAEQYSAKNVHILENILN